MEVDLIEEDDTADLQRIRALRLLRGCGLMPHRAQIGEPGHRGTETIGQVDRFDLRSALRENQAVEAVAGCELLGEDGLEQPSQSQEDRSGGGSTVEENVHARDLRQGVKEGHLALDLATQAGMAGVLVVR